MTETATEATEGLERPEFRGCLVCYSAEWTAYGVRKLGRTLRSSD